MHGIYELKEMLCKELEGYGTKGELSAGTLDIVDKLAHTIKNLDKIIECYEEDEGSYGMSMREDMRRGGSYANRRMSRNRYSNEGYSRNADIAERLRDLMADAPDERTRNEIQRLVNKMEQM